MPSGSKPGESMNQSPETRHAFGVFHDTYDGGSVASLGYRTRDFSSMG